MANNNELLDRLNSIMEKNRDVNSGVNTSDNIENVTTKPQDNENIVETSEELDVTKEDITQLMNDISGDSYNEKEDAPTQPTMSKAEMAREKYAPIKTVEPEPVKEEQDDPREVGSGLFNMMNDLDAEIKTETENLQKMQNEYLESISKPPVEDVNTVENDDGSDDINDIISEIGEVPIENKKEEEQDLEKLLEEYESSKVYADLDKQPEVTGPADYIIESDESYDSNVESILERNEIKVVKKNAADRDAILNKYVNSGDKITMALPNSGIYITVSGAGATEIIDMNSMDGSVSDMQYELEKLNHVCQHITGSSVGKLKLAELIKIVSYWDKDCLYYALFAATHPTVSEISKSCDKCGREYFLRAHTKDLMINPEDFEKEISDIRDNVTTMARLKETSKLGKVYKKAHSNGMIIYYKHPSIESYLRTQNSLSDETKRKHEGIIDLAYGIDKIAIRVKDNEFIEYTDPNDIINIISKMKNVDEKYEIFDMIEAITPNAKPLFGFKETTCPICGGKNNMSTFTMDSLLFTQAQLEEYEASLRWAVRAQKRTQERKKRKSE